MMKERVLTARAVALWERRGDALKASSELLEEKPDRDEWTHAERRMFTCLQPLTLRVKAS